MNNKLRMNIMKKQCLILAAFAAAIALSSGCAKSSNDSVNESAKRYFDAWMSINHPDLKATDKGVYILEDEEGKGNSLGEAEDIPYLFVTYTATSLDGTVSSSTDENIQKQLGTYNKANYYGPAVWIRADSYMKAGVEYAIEGMKVGGTRKVIIPGWLMTNNRYSTEEGYLNKTTGTNAIYKIHISGMTSDIIKWQIDSLERYTARYMDNVDSTIYGFYYQQLKAPKDTNAFGSDSTVYINYIGRLLNGQVFDTNIADTAKFYNIYSSSTTYEPTQINWGEAYTDLTMGSDENSIITGFSYCLFKMRSMEKARCVFYSTMGYGYSGSGAKIPSYAPLRFDIELVANPDDDD